MGLITKEVEIGLNGTNVSYLENLGYYIPRRENNTIPQKTKIIVKVEDLKDNSKALVNAKCDSCGCNSNKDISWRSYKKSLDKYGGYYCHKCIMELYGRDKISKMKLKNSKSFETWCIDNNRQDVLDRWDYELNYLNPYDVPSKSSKKYWFKCNINIHNSELNGIADLTSGKQININCKQCNSFAQWGIDNIGEDFLEKYWDYDKNININPWDIPSQYNKKVYIKCQEKDYHESYPVKCNGFVGRHNRCPYCAGKNIHPLDSLGTVYSQVLEIWSDKNNKSPYEYSPKSKQIVYWKCPNGKHKDYPRKIGDSNKCNYRCPECDYSKGEEKISNFFIKKGFIKIDQDDFNQLVNGNKYNENYFIPQMKYDGLVGLGNRLLSYDFYIPKYNLLIEYQGSYHDGTAGNQTEEEFKIQQEHDRRKKEYTKINNIKLLEIWYWDFDNIETILEKELNLIKTYK